MRRGLSSLRRNVGLFRFDFRNFGRRLRPLTNLRTTAKPQRLRHLKRLPCSEAFSVAELMFTQNFGPIESVVKVMRRPARMI